MKDKTTKQPKLNIRNWECGIVVPVVRTLLASMSGKEADGNDKDTYNGSRGHGAGPPSMEVFEGHVPVPMIVPGEEYGVKRPWFYTER